jgi:hypothetical protein
VLENIFSGRRFDAGTREFRGFSERKIHGYFFMVEVASVQKLLNATLDPVFGMELL